MTEVIINRLAGTVLTLGEERIRAALEPLLSSGRGVDLHFLEPDALVSRLHAAVGRATDRSVIIGGGDGTISRAASILARTGIPLGVLPLGTMNLFCRTIGMPLDVTQAAHALLSARPASIDLGEVNGELFIHHASLGLHPRLVTLRNARGYRSRIDKMVGSVVSWFRVLARPSAVHIHIEMEGRHIRMDTPALLVSNNRLRRAMGALPLPETLDAGILEIHIARSGRTVDVINMSLAALVGRWDDDTLFETIELSHFSVDLKRHAIRASIDGEIVSLRPPLVFDSCPGALILLKPVI